MNSCSYEMDEQGYMGLLTHEGGISVHVHLLELCLHESLHITNHFVSLSRASLLTCIHPREFQLTSNKCQSPEGGNLPDWADWLGECKLLSERE